LDVLSQPKSKLDTDSCAKVKSNSHTSSIFDC
jgi:hypothetical protein